MIYRVKGIVLSLLSCIFLMLFRQRVRLDMFRLFPGKPKSLGLSWFTSIFSLCCLFAMMQDRSPSECLRETGDPQFTAVSPPPPLLWLLEKYEKTFGCWWLHYFNINYMKLSIWSYRGLLDNAKTVQFSHIFLRSGNWKIIDQKMQLNGP